MKSVTRLLNGFSFAWHGILFTVRTQRNMRIHINAVFLVILTGLLARLSAWKWAAVLICCGLVMALEMVNTALEQLCDLVKPEQNATIRIVKDCSAGAVLMMSLFSVAVEMVVLFSDNTADVLLETLQTHPWAAIVLIAAVILSVLHVLFFSAWKLARKKQQRSINSGRR